MHRLFLIAGLVAVHPLAAQQPARWLATWAPSPHPSAARPPADSVDRVPTYVDRTLRQILRTTIGGNRLRIRITNEFGDRPLVIGAAHVAIRDTGVSIRAGTDRTITFGGQSTITLRRGAVVTSDPVDMSVPQLTDIAISIWVKDSARASTRHALGLQTNYISPPGDFTGTVAMRAASTVRQWIWLAGVDVVNPKATGVIVTLGNSITDGAGSTADSNTRWPDVLARRLLASKEKPKAVVNAGISGNGVILWLTGQNALGRFDRDVLMQPGLTHIILLEGINDLSQEGVTAQDVIFGYKQLINRAHERGIVIFGATMTGVANMPFPTAGAIDARRREVNDWIRTSKAFDGVIDFDAATRDPSQPNQMLPINDSGDHLHPSNAGYKAMGEAIKLELFRQKFRAGGEK